MVSNSRKILFLLALILFISSIFYILFVFSSNTKTNIYKERFHLLWNSIHNANNNYFNKDGIPYESAETLLIDDVDYGHLTTSDTISQYLWLETIYGKVTGDWAKFKTAWDVMENYMIPGIGEQPNFSAYNPEFPSYFSIELDDPTIYPTELDNTITSVGYDNLYNDLDKAYKPGDNKYIYSMHWLIDADNWYGFENAATDKPAFIDTYKRGPKETVFDTIPHPAWEDFKWGGSTGFVDLFINENEYKKQWQYTTHPTADSKIIQSVYWANKWANKSKIKLDTYNKKAAKIGNFLRYSFYDKYFKNIGVQNSDPNVNNENAHYLLASQYSWGGAIESAQAWIFTSNYCYAAQQNPMTAWILSESSIIPSISETSRSDWNTSLTRQIEFYQWLQSKEGSIASGVTNSLNGKYDPYPSEISTFYDMAYIESPKNISFKSQTESMLKVAELYYETGNEFARRILEKWIYWTESVIIEPGTENYYEFPSKLSWKGQPDKWTGYAPDNSSLNVLIDSYDRNPATAALYASTLLYYSAGTKKWPLENNLISFSKDSHDYAKSVLDNIWTNFKTPIGITYSEKFFDIKKVFEQEVYVPEGWTGKMPNGDTIETRKTFFDIRSKYKNDPSWLKLQKSYETGKIPELTIHRFKDQSNIAVAYALYYILFGMDNSDLMNTSNHIINENKFSTPETSSVIKTINPTTLLTSDVKTTTTQNLNIDVQYNVKSEWKPNATIDIIIENKSSTPIEDWSIEWAYPSGYKITTIWNGKLSQIGESVVIKNMPYNKDIPPHGKVSFGFHVISEGKHIKPSRFNVNGIEIIK